MDLVKIEARRSGLVQFLVVLIMIFLALIMIVSWQDDESHLVKALAILSLLACLYVIAKERSLKSLHDQLVEELTHKRRQVHSLGRELKAEKNEFNELEGRLKELTSLYRAISTVNAVADPRLTFEAVLTAAVELVGGDCGSLMLVDETEGRLTFASAIGLSQSILNRSSQKIGEGIAGWVAQNAEPVLLTGPIGEDERFTNLEVREPELNVAISIPLKLSGCVIGVLNMGSTVEAERYTFNEEELRFSYLFAQHAAVAIERALLLKGKDSTLELYSH